MDTITQIQVAWELHKAGQKVVSYPQQVIQGVVLVLAVAVDMYTRRLENR